MLKSIFFKIMSDEKQRQKINSLKEKNEIFELFCENGYRKSFDDFEKDMIDFLNSEDSKNLISNNFDELSDEMLEMIAGGVNAKQAATAGIATLLTTFTIGAIGSQMLSQNNTAPPSSTDTVSISSSTQDDSNFSSNNDNQPANDNGGQNTNNNSNENKPNGPKTMNNRKSPGGGFINNNPGRPGEYDNKSLYRSPQVLAQDESKESKQQDEYQHNKDIEEINNYNEDNGYIVSEQMEDVLNKYKQKLIEVCKQQKIMLQSLWTKINQLNTTDEDIQKYIVQVNPQVDNLLCADLEGLSSEEVINHLKNANDFIQQMEGVLDEYKQQLIEVCKQTHTTLQSLLTKINNRYPIGSRIPDNIMQLESKVQRLLLINPSHLSLEEAINHLKNADDFIQQMEGVLDEYQQQDEYKQQNIQQDNKDIEEIENLNEDKLDISEDKQQLIKAYEQKKEMLRNLLKEMDKLNPTDEDIKNYIMQVKSQVNNLLYTDLSTFLSEDRQNDYLKNANSLIEQMNNVLNKYQQQDEDQYNEDKQQLIEACEQKKEMLLPLLRQMHVLKFTDPELQTQASNLRTQVHTLLRKYSESSDSEEKLNSFLETADDLIEQMNNVLDEYKQQQELIEACKQKHTTLQSLLKEMNQLKSGGKISQNDITGLESQVKRLLLINLSHLSLEEAINHSNNADNYIRQMKNMLNEYQQQQQQELIEACKQKQTKLQSLLKEMNQLKSGGKISQNDITGLESQVKRLLLINPNHLSLAEAIKHSNNADNLIRQMDNVLKK